MKKRIIMICGSIFAILIILGAGFLFINKNNTKEDRLEDLPKPEITGGTRGELGIDKNINESTIDQYLNREDSVYRDMRMLEDPGNYEAIGGNRFLSGYIEGFEVIPLPYIIPVTELPNEVGDTYTGTTLFYNDNGTYIANYKESMSIIENIFPKDKIIFLMCGGGGYSGMMKNFLVSLGWDENKIYNTGGYWYYKGNHNVNIKKEVDGTVSYDFEKVPYHNIEFDKLTKSANYKAPIIKVTEVKLNTSQIELEEGTSFQLNAIVLPNEASNKELKWTSDNESIATVSNEGLVKALKAGTSTITVKSVEGEKANVCKVIVNEKTVTTRIKVDDLSEEIKRFDSYDLRKLEEEYYSEDRLGKDNNQKKEEYKKYSERVEQAKKIRLEIFNKLIDDKKTFIVLVHYKDCDERPYSVFDGAEKILKENNYLYLSVETPGTYEETTIYDSKLNMDNSNDSPVLIIKNGEIYANIDLDSDSIKNDEETKNWLSKYIDLN